MSEMVVTPDYVVEVEEKRFFHPPGTNIANVGTGTYMFSSPVHGIQR